MVRPHSAKLPGKQDKEPKNRISSKKKKNHRSSEWSLGGPLEDVGSRKRT